MVQDGSVTEAPDLVKHTKKDAIQRRRMKIFELRLKQSKSNVEKSTHSMQKQSAYKKKGTAIPCKQTPPIICTHQNFQTG
jgi:hypothetical protein